MDFNKIINNKKERAAIAREDHFLFFNLYLNHYVSYPFADFHHQLFRITEDESVKTALVMAFRSSAKSTILTLSYPIWAILGKPQKKFIVILGETQRQARQQLANIRLELSGNELLKEDLGPFKELTDEWGNYSLVIPKYGARITAASMEQSIRGIRHGQYRPDLIICDDIENLQSVKTKEGRNRIHQWISGEVIPAGDKNTKIIFVGNLLHEDSLLMRMKDRIETGEMDGKVVFVPLVDDRGMIAWPGKYKNMEEIERERKKLANEISWQREFLLRIMSDQEKVIHEDWIHYYDELPQCDGKPWKHPDFRFCAVGIDPAISEKESADYTAIVPAYVYGYNENMRIYVLPNIINFRINFPDAVKYIINIAKSNLTLKKQIFFIENFSFQDSLRQQINSEVHVSNLEIQGFSYKADKREKLALTSFPIMNGTILFPKNYSQELINQIVNIGKEKHDDLADAFSLLCIKVLSMDHNKLEPRIRFLG